MSFSVILNSNLRSSGTVSDARYMFDWNVLPAGKYRMTWGFISGQVNLGIANTPVDPLLIDAQLGQNTVFRSNALYTRPDNSMCIGIVSANENVASTYMYSAPAANAPIFLQRPFDTEFSVRILNSNAVSGVWTDSAVATLGKYILTLYFEQIV